MTAPELRFFAEFHCWPLWFSHDDGGEENPDPHDFGLAPDLADDLVAWSEEFDALFDEDDFSKPLWDDPDDKADFDRRGLDLARRVAEALGEGWSVRYHERSGRWVTLS